MEPISAGILGGVGLLSSLGQALFGAAQAERQAIQGAIARQGEAEQKIYGQQAEKSGQGLSSLIEAYRASLMG